MSLLALLTSLALLPAIALAALLAEGIVIQALLLADDVTHLVHHLHHLLVLLTLLTGHLTALQGFQHLAQLTQHFLGRLARSLPRHVLQVLQHALEVFRTHDLVGVHALRHRLLVLLGLPRQLLHELGQRLAKLLHQSGNFLVGGAFFQSLRQLILDIPQPPLSIGQATAIFDPKRDVPELIHRATQCVATAVLGQTIVDGSQAEINVTIVDEAVRLHGQRIERAHDERTIARILDQLAALFDNRLGKRIPELALRQDDLDRLALADVAAVILGDQRHADLHAGPRMSADFMKTRCLGFLGVMAWQPQRQHGRPLQRRPWSLQQIGARPACAWIACPSARALETGLGRGNAVVVLDLVEQLHGAADGVLRLLGQRDARSLIGNHAEIPRSNFGSPAEETQRSRARQFAADFGNIRSILRQLTFDRCRFTVRARLLERKLAGAAGANDDDAFRGHLNRPGTVD